MLPFKTIPVSLYLILHAEERKRYATLWVAIKIVYAAQHRT